MRSYVAVVLAVAMFLVPCASAAGRVGRVELNPGKAVVTVRESDATALPEAEVELQTRAGKLVKAFTADKKGTCTVEDLEPGSYRLKVANRAYVPFVVSKEAEHSSLLVILPPEEDYAAGEPKEAFHLAWLTNPWVIAGLVAVAIAVPVAVHDGDGGGAHHGPP
ncbi:MAG: carboxypeptidase-like regulatory domain-containing protein [Planctomycetota bacterium]